MNLRGLVSPAVMEKGEKVGYDLLDLGSGERRRLAYRKGEADGDLVTNNWHDGGVYAGLGERNPRAHPEM